MEATRQEEAETAVTTKDDMYRRRVKALTGLVDCVRSGNAPSHRLAGELEATGRHIGPDGEWLAEDTPTDDIGDVYADLRP